MKTLFWHYSSIFSNILCNGACDAAKNCAPHWLHLCEWRGVSEVSPGRRIAWKIVICCDSSTSLITKNFRFLCGHVCLSLIDYVRLCWWFSNHQTNATPLLTSQYCNLFVQIVMKMQFGNSRMTMHFVIPNDSPRVGYQDRHLFRVPWPEGRDWRKSRPILLCHCLCDACIKHTPQLSLFAVL